MTTTLDALPLPVPTHFRNGVLYAFSADQIRAARREGYELAMRKAQEGREPVAWRDHVEQRMREWRQSRMNKWGDQLALDDFMDKESLDDLIDYVCSEYEWTPSPPPKSDEARDAERLLPHGYLLAKVAMVVPLLEEARDAMTALTVEQMKLHRISATLADRMDVAGTYSLEDWNAAQQKGEA